MNPSENGNASLAAEFTRRVEKGVSVATLFDSRRDDQLIGISVGPFVAGE